MTERATTQQGTASGAGEDAHWFIGELIRVRIRGEETDDRFAFVEHTAARGAETPWHVQPEDDEAWYVIEGELSFWIGDADAQPVTAGPGATMLAPRGVPHAFRVDSESARYVTVHTPAGHERFYRDAGQPAPDLTIPPTADLDMQRLMRTCQRHGVEILGPPPGAAEVAASRAAS
jgi:quercetin dioxygenase-like cupin family protein